LTKEKRDLKFRILNGICSTVIMGSIIYIVVAGIELFALSVFFVALASVAAPVILSGDGFADIMFGIFEAIIEGLASIVTGLVEAIAAIFN